MARPVSRPKGPSPSSDGAFDRPKAVGGPSPKRFPMTGDRIRCPIAGAFVRRAVRCAFRRAVRWTSDEPSDGAENTAISGVLAPQPLPAALRQALSQRRRGSLRRALWGGVWCGRAAAAAASLSARCRVRGVASRRCWKRFSLCAFLRRGVSPLSPGGFLADCKKKFELCGAVPEGRRGCP